MIERTQLRNLALNDAPIGAPEGGGVTRRNALRLFGAGGLAIAIAGVGTARAQDGSPTPDTGGGLALADGVVLQPLASTPVQEMAGVSLVLWEMRLDSGASLGAHAHPGTVIVSVREGALGVTLENGTATVTRSRAAGDTPMATPEPLDMGQELVLEVGSSVSFERDAVHAIRNAGEGEALVSIAGLVDVAMAPVLMEEDRGATPES